jgi:hypothetical protein
MPIPVVALAAIQERDRELELTAVPHTDRGEMFEVSWHHRDGSGVITVLTHATEEARAYLAERLARIEGRH